MACDTNSNAFTKLAGQMSGAITQLSGKQAFLAGVAVGVAGTGLGTFLVSKRRRLANLFQGQRPGSLTPGTRPQPVPIPGLSQTPSVKSKPKPIPGLSATTPAKAKPKPIPGISPTAGNTQAIATQTKLRPAEVQVRGNQDEMTKLANSYQVVRSDGTDTGLAVTPHLQPDGRVKEDAWSVTHVASGALIDGPYESVTQAQGLATNLSGLGWAASRLAQAEVKQAKTMIARFRQSLSEKPS